MSRRFTTTSRQRLPRFQFIRRSEGFVRAMACRHKLIFWPGEFLACAKSGAGLWMQVGFRLLTGEQWRTAGYIEVGEEVLGERLKEQNGGEALLASAVP